MKRAWFRSSLFNIAFFSVNALCCIIMLPALLLPRPQYMRVIMWYHFLIYALEYFILDLRFEVRGLENLPKKGPYLVAAKHMSAYETFKLHFLFDDPAIILKKELLKIPLWGAFLKKSDVIEIDRSTPRAADKSMTDGALRMKEQGRAIVIFPQGTRIWPHETTKEKPYKNGIYRIQEATALPIIPMATNSGMFCPRTGWLKSSGSVVFSILPPEEAGQNKRALMDKLEHVIETETDKLMQEAKDKNKTMKPSKTGLLILLGLAVLFGGYSYLWFKVAEQVKISYVDFMSNLQRSTDIVPPRITGYPGPIHLSVLQDRIETSFGTINFKILEGKGWPVPFAPISIITGPISVENLDWRQPITLSGIKAKVVLDGQVIDIKQSTILANDYEAHIAGTVDIAQVPVPRVNLMVDVKNHPALLLDLSSRGIIEQRIALFLTAGLTALMSDDGLVHVPIQQRGLTVYAGPLPITQLPDAKQRVVSPSGLPPLEPYNQLGQDQ